jgi:acetoin:2,6-dichlorophenolindophenol oxidoreductase subunit beta
MPREATYADAILEATTHAMETDPSVIVCGLGVPDPSGIYGTTVGLQDRFGAARVFDTPLSEDAMTGIAIGAAMAGMRPIHVHVRMDFVLLAMNQLINVAAKCRYMYAGRVTAPLIVRAVIGRSWGQGPQHSQALHSLFTHVPGIRVVAPTTPYDAKGLLTTALRTDDPVLFVEHRMLHGQSGHVPAGDYTVPFGRARVLTEGEDVTVVGVSHMILECLRARRHLSDVGVTAEVIDPVSLSPLDIDTIAASVRKTRRLLIVDHAWVGSGLSAEILAQVVEALGDEGAGERPAVKYRRMGFAATPCPTTRVLEDAFYPTPATIASAAYALVNPAAQPWEPSGQASPEIVEFRGPF